MKTTDNIYSNTKLKVHNNHGNALKQLLNNVEIYLTWQMYLLPFFRMNSMENDKKKLNDQRNEVTCIKHFTVRY